MITTTTMQNSPVRTIKAKVEQFEGSTLLNTYSYDGDLVSINIDRIGEESKFFGFGICQKTNIKLRDLARQKNITTTNSFKLYFNSNNQNEYFSNFPIFNVTEVHRDENSNQLSITAYDGIHRAEERFVSEVELTSYTVREFAQACSELIGAAGLEIIGVGDTETCFDTYYPEGANFDGSENIRFALNAIAEATQTIYYLNCNNVLVFKRLDMNGEPVLTIGKSDYITLESKTNRRLVSVAHVTELGDNVEDFEAGELTGTTQYIRNNPFWDMRDDIAALVENATRAVYGFTINQFDCSWRGNYLLEVGDKIALITKDDEEAHSYVINDVLFYSGGLDENTRWNYNNSDAETATNPSSLGEVLNQTLARVDKINKEIDLIASASDEYGKTIASLQIDTQNITSTVERIERDTRESIDNINAILNEVYTKIEQTAEDVKISINEILENGIDKITTSTGFTFNENGLTVSKSESEMSTLITEDGMTVYKNNQAVLTANNTGVDAVNLHATTYLIIGTNSRFEDYAYNRTGCFWIGN